MVGFSSKMCFTLVVLVFLLHNFAMSSKVPVSVGINYGRLGDDLPPPPPQAVAVIRSLGFRQVKIYDSDPAVLGSLSNTGLHPFFPATRIRLITVGNELLSHPELRNSWAHLFPAMQNLQTALQTVGLHRYIKVSTCISMDALNTSYPPSAGVFRPDIADDILRPILKLLSSTSSYLFVIAYPYYAWSENNDEVPLEYALLQGDADPVSDGEFKYGNLLDAQMDAFVAAMEAVGFPDVKIAISETGWPTGGGVGATVGNAAVYNGRLLKRMATKLGTPRKPNVSMPTFIFALFDENQKPGLEIERNWGILYPNASHIYAL